MSKPSKKDIQAFVKTWKGRGDEQQDSTTFWTDFLIRCLGVIPETIPSFARFEKQVHGKTPSGKNGYRRADVLIPDHRVLIEQKSLGVDLDKPRDNNQWGLETPFQQARWYANNLPFSQRPRWIITCNFETFRLYDLDEDIPEDNYVEVALEELPDQMQLFSFIKSEQTSQIHKEQELSFEAGKRVTRLYDALSKCYLRLDDNPEEQRSLNVVITRIVFLLYAEDAGLLGDHNAFGSYCQGNPQSLRERMIRLFETVDTPEAQRDPYLDPRAVSFPYVNGGLFHDRTVIVPQLTADVATTIVEISAEFDWKDISPVIFGGVFEGTLNPETRHAGGMHYTSIENIDRCLRPLFLDRLWDDLHYAEGLKTEVAREQRLNELHDEIANLTLLDPACGSGNFLSRAYTQLREIENRILEDKAALHGGGAGQMQLDVGDPIRVRLDHFYGIEINDFAVAVARTSLWIAEEQMLARTQELMPGYHFDFLPLRSNEAIVEGNALEASWTDVVNPHRLSYICGNPPFLGARNMSAKQKNEIRDIAQDVRHNHDLDYVTGWYLKSLDMMDLNPSIRAALVSTNSVCQGTTVGNLWMHLVQKRTARIDFAWRTFVWDNEAVEKAHVHCVIVGFSKKEAVARAKRVYDPTDGSWVEGSNITPYLTIGPDVFVCDRREPICAVPPMANGNQPRDGGNLILSVEEREEILKREPGLDKYIRRYVGSEEFLKDKWRYCLWLEDATPLEIANSPELSKRVQAVYEFRKASKAKTTNGYAKTPALFAQRPQKQGCDFLILPRVSSSRRRYLPLGYMNKLVVSSDSAQVIPDADLYTFGVLQSQMHNAWMRQVAGRLKSDYRYSKEIVYNCFVWPNATGAQRARIKKAAQGVLDAREACGGMTHAQMYDPKNEGILAPLMDAHDRLDRAVAEAYGISYDGLSWDERENLSATHLFRLYARQA